MADNPHRAAVSGRPLSFGVVLPEVLMPCAVSKEVAVNTVEVVFWEKGGLDTVFARGRGGEQQSGPRAVRGAMSGERLECDHRKLWIADTEALPDGAVLRAGMELAKSAGRR
jgi:hypothetical protein